MILVFGHWISEEPSKMMKLSIGQSLQTTFLMLLWHKPLIHGPGILIKVESSQLNPYTHTSLKFNCRAHKIYSSAFGRSNALKEWSSFYGKLLIHVSRPWIGSKNNVLGAISLLHGAAYVKIAMNHTAIYSSIALLWPLFGRKSPFSLVSSCP